MGKGGQRLSVRVGATVDSELSLMQGYAALLAHTAPWEALSMSAPQAVLKDALTELSKAVAHGTIP